MKKKYTTILKQPHVPHGTRLGKRCNTIGAPGRIFSHAFVRRRRHFARISCAGAAEEARLATSFDRKEKTEVSQGSQQQRARAEARIKPRLPIWAAPSSPRGHGATALGSQKQSSPQQGPKCPLKGQSLPCPRPQRAKEINLSLSHHLVGTHFHPTASLCHSPLS